MVTDSGAAVKFLTIRKQTSFLEWQFNLNHSAVPDLRSDPGRKTCSQVLTAEHLMDSFRFCRVVYKPGCATESKISNLQAYLTIFLQVSIPGRVAVIAGLDVKAVVLINEPDRDGARLAAFSANRRDLDN